MLWSWVVACLVAPLVWESRLGLAPAAPAAVSIQILLIQAAGLCLLGLHLRFYRSARRRGRSVPLRETVGKVVAQSSAAQAGVHLARKALDSRLRGNDGSTISSFPTVSRVGNEPRRLVSDTPLAVAGSLSATVLALALAALCISAKLRWGLSVTATLWWLATILAADWWIRRASRVTGLAPTFWALLLQSLVTTTIAGSFVYGPDLLFPMRIYPIDSESMEPTIHGDAQDGDWVLVDHRAYRDRKPQRLEVVLFISPLDPEVRYIKRVIGLPGEQLALSDGGEVLIHGRALALPAPLRYQAPATGPFRLGESVLIPPRHYVVLGDADAASTLEHPLSSFDCRRWTMIEYEMSDGTRLCLDPEAPVTRTERSQRFRDVNGVPRQVERSAILSARRRPVPTLDERYLSGQVVAICWPPGRLRALTASARPRIGDRE